MIKGVVTKIWAEYGEMTRDKAVYRTSNSGGHYYHYARRGKGTISRIWDLWIGT